MKRSHLAREIIETIALTLVIFIVIHFAIQSYHVEGVSMNPGLVNDEYVIVNKMAYLFHQPERGEVIVFHYPKDTTRDFIKRVIAIPGDTLTIDSSTVRVNGVLLNEPYISQAANPNGYKGTVPPDNYFVMGDNRPVSDDSRIWGFVPKYDLVGKAVAVYWPLNRWEIIDSHSSVFSQIK